MSKGAKKIHFIPVTKKSALKVCMKCGSENLYLKKKQRNYGVFCLECDRWQDWILVTDIPIYEKLGVVFEEDFIKECNHQLQNT